MPLSICILSTFMCSFLFTNKKNCNEKDLLQANFYQQFRGPDLTSYKKIDEFHFLHNLLSITGDTFTPQPLYTADQKLVTIFNGEIYNYKKLTPTAYSDGDCIIPTYKQYGDSFFNNLDGEFAIILLDNIHNKIIFGSDCFGTKPIFFSIENNSIGIASYRSALKKLGYNEIYRVYGNYFYIFNLKTKKLTLHNVTQFDVNNEYKKDFNDWNKAFEDSLFKRTDTNKHIFMGLSEGFDSGAICCGLVKNNKDFKAYSVNVQDTPSNVLLWRHGLAHKEPPIIGNMKTRIPNIEKKEYIDGSKLSLLHNTKKEIYDSVEDYTYSFYHHKDNKFYQKNCRETYGFIGAGIIFRRARLEGYKICLSGLAGDAIGYNEINNYYKKFNDINAVIDFDDNHIYSCEYCTGVHGIEVRYPFLDKKLWQETFWLDKSIYKHFKEPQRQYMHSQGFPFIDIDSKGEEIFEKIGFWRQLPGWFFNKH